MSALLRCGDTPPELEADTQRIVALAEAAYGLPPEFARALVDRSVANAEGFAALVRR